MGKARTERRRLAKIAFRDELVVRWQCASCDKSVPCDPELYTMGCLSPQVLVHVTKDIEGLWASAVCRWHSDKSIYEEFKAQNDKEYELQRAEMASEEEVATGSAYNDIKELIPVMNKLGMTRAQRNEFQHSILDVLWGGLESLEDPYRHFNRVEALPAEHRTEAYSYIIAFLEKVAK